MEDIIISIDRAKSLLRTERTHKQALQLLKEKVAQYPESAELYTECAKVQILKAKPPLLLDGISNANIAIDLRPNNSPMAYFSKGKGLYYLGLYKEACNCYVLGLQYDSNHGALLEGLEQCQARLRDISGNRYEKKAQRKINNLGLSDYLKQAFSGTDNTRPRFNSYSRRKGDKILKDDDTNNILRAPVSLMEKYAFGDRGYREVDYATSLKEKRHMDIEKISRGFLGAPPVINLVSTLSGSRYAIQKLYENGQYERDVQEICSSAEHHFRIHITAYKEYKNPCVIFDVDDTAISTYEEMKRRQFKEIPMFCPSFIAESSAPPINPVLNLYLFLLKNGIKVIFLSDRRHEAYGATLANLHKAGYNEFDTLIMRPRMRKVSQQVNDSQAMLMLSRRAKSRKRSQVVADELKKYLKKESSELIDYKEEQRKALAARGYQIVGVVGDQMSDVSGEEVGFAIKIPNYLYSLS